MKKCILVILIGLALGLNGCNAIYFLKPARATATQKIVVAVTPVYPSFIVRNNNYSGIDHDLVQMFAMEYGYEVEFKVLPNLQAVKKAIHNNKADLAVGRIFVNPRSRLKSLNGPVLEETELDLICRKSSRIKDMNDLTNKTILVGHNYHSIKSAQLLKEENDLANLILTGDKTPHILKRISNKLADCAILERLEAKYSIRYFPNLETTLSFPTKIDISWLVQVDNTALKQNLFHWFQQKTRMNQLLQIYSRYADYLDRLHYLDVYQYFRNIETLLPTYEKHFKQNAKRFSLPWELVAAVAYQESHWNKDAISYTNVKGLMMLTKETAEHMGVEDRTCPEQSIHGGAKFLRYLFNKFPKTLHWNDRMMLTLASYNVGLYHLRDAQKLAVRLGKNPYSWKDMRKVLPLLSEEKYYRHLEYGKARGFEPVIFAERVRNFYELLKFKL